MAAPEHMERHERTLELPHLTPFAKRIAIVVAMLAALLAVSEVFAENRIAKVITDETKISHLSTTLEIDQIQATLGDAGATDAHPEVKAEIANVEDHQESYATAHLRLEFAIILLQVGIVLSSVSALVGAIWLLRAGGVLGLLGAGFLLAGLLA
jgi:hypothetical protein